MNNAYRALFVSRIATAIKTAKAASGITNTGVKGTIREILIKDLFRPLLPPDLGLGTGHLITAINEMSPQQDIVIYNRRILPPIVYEDNLGLFPIESVIATIEVKSTLTMQELRTTYETAKEVHGYSYLSGRVDEDTGRVVSHNVKKSISAVFALDSDLASEGKTELERYLELHKSDDTPLRVICVSGRGYWYFSDVWNFIHPDEEYQEILSFIVGLLDIFIGVGYSRRQPGLVSYLIDKPPIVRVSA